MPRAFGACLDFARQERGNLQKTRTGSVATPPGFTLVEVLVALAVFSLAALALLRLGGAALGTAARLDEKAVAAIVAANVAAETRLAAAPPAFGTDEGSETNAGRAWRWRRTTARTPDPRLARIDISVLDAEGGTAAVVTVLR